MKCNKCGKHFEEGNTNGLPNGVAFVLDHGKTITLCQECVIELGKMNDADKDKIIKSWIGNKH